MYNLSLSAFDIANAWMISIPVLLIIAVLVFIVGFTVVTVFTHIIKRKQAKNNNLEKTEQGETLRKSDEKGGEKDA